MSTYVKRIERREPNDDGWVRALRLDMPNERWETP